MRLSASFYYCCLTAVCGAIFLQSGAQALRADGDSPGTRGRTAANSEVLEDAVLEKELALLENRFFFHQYPLDPAEKRLERLELLTLGGSQYGSNNDRLGRLKVAIVQHDQTAAQTMAKTRSRGGGSESNYPVLSTLEWRVLKKTFLAESIDQRLDRLESQLFGLPSQAMSYVDRIERLKKTVGIGVDMPGQSNSYTAVSPSRGPMPRDYAGLTRGFSSSLSPFVDEDGSSLNGDMGSLTDQLLPESGQISDFGGFTALPRMRSRSGIGSGANGSNNPNNSFDFGFGSPDSLLERMQKPMNDLLRGLGLTPYPAAPSFDSPVNPLPATIPMPGCGIMSILF